MNSITIHQLASLATGRTNIRVDIFHTKRKSTYRVTGYRKIDIDCMWHTYIDYECVNTGKKYARHAQNFHNFNEAK